MRERLDVSRHLPEVLLIEDADLRDRVVSVWEDLWQRSSWDKLESMPISLEIDYPHLPHNRAVVALALAIAVVLERFHDVTVDRDLLIAAALLQDVSKLIELTPGEAGGYEETEAGRLYPHAFLAAHVALEHGLPHAVCDIILNHTPQAARFPSSLEGKILYYADQLDIIAVFGDRWRKELMITK